MCVLVIFAMIEGERLQASEAHQICVFDAFDGDACVVQKLCLNLGDLVQVEDDGRVRNVERGDGPFGGQRLNPATGDIRRISE